MPVFHPVVQAVKKVSWLASWNSEPHSLLGHSHRLEIKMGDGSTSQGKSMFHFKGQTTGLDFFLSFFINSLPRRLSGEKRKRIKSTNMAKAIQPKSNRKETPSR
ncbi:hypothetical protein [Echinicola rosea]|uniref:hypothetical protein n=1 Tax=Echinicola rosea TaxID=1807691 RepID=UPI0010CA7010|nr:hypothetical protein [Echinicola rosea]